MDFVSYVPDATMAMALYAYARRDIDTFILMHMLAAGEVAGLLIYYADVGGTGPSAIVDGLVLLWCLRYIHRNSPTPHQQNGQHERIDITEN